MKREPAMRKARTPWQLAEDVLDTYGVPSDCGLIAAAAFAYLDKLGIKARILYIRYGRDHGHCIVVFESAGRLNTYDRDGCLRFSSDATWKTPPRLLARAWAKYMRIEKHVTGAKWFTKGR